MTKKIPGLGSLFSIIFAVLILNTCDLFQESLVEYLREEEPNQEEIAEDDGPWVYVNVNLPDDTNNTGWSKTEPVKTIGKALDIWVDSVPPGEPVEAKIMLLEDITGSYDESGIFNTNDSLVDCAGFANVVTRNVITAVTLAGAAGVKIDNGGVSGRRVLCINNPGKTITLKNLIITGGNLPLGDGGGISLRGGSLFIAEGVVITNNSARSGGGVYVLINSGQFTMADGDIYDNHATLRGGGMYVNSGKAAMIRGTIRNNTAGEAGGGIFAGNNSTTFTMEGGEIYENMVTSSTAGKGGGVGVAGNGIFTMKGGYIRENISKKEGGGVWVGKNAANNLASFTMEGGEIYGNKADDTTGIGGGVCVAAEGTFTMKGGTIRDNESGNDGGGIYVSGASSAALIERGSIGVQGGGNRAKYGGGVFVGASGTLKLGLDGVSGGPEIQYNTALLASGSSTGGGVVINGSGAEAYLYQGTISHNTTYKWGGGILVVNGTLDMRGGTITGNQVDASGAGPGLVVEPPSGLLRLSGFARVGVGLNDDPIFLPYQQGWNPKIFLSTFYGDLSDGSAIAKIVLGSGYVYNGTIQVLDGDLSYRYNFIIDPSGHNINGSGMLQ